MQTFQQRTLGRIEQIAVGHGFECSQSGGWANTGRIQVHKKGATEAFAVIGYEFQQDYYKLTLTVHGERIRSQAGRNDYFDFYQNNEAPSAFWTALNVYLKANKSTASGEPSRVCYNLLPAKDKP